MMENKDKLWNSVGRQLKEECCGCSACMIVCNKNAIKMKKDEMGFYYPYVDTDECVGCGACIKVCPLK